MKNIIQLKYLLILLVLGSANKLFAQESYNDIQQKVKTALDDAVKKSQYKILQKLVSNFEQSKKLSAANLTKDNVGICVFIAGQDNDIDIFPARYTYENGKIDFSALRSKDTQKPSESMREYVNTYLNDFNNLGKTKVFKSLMLNEPQTYGTYTSNNSEYIVKEPYTKTFVRGNSDWMYAISIGNQGIIVYAFKMSLSEENLSQSATAQKIDEEKMAEIRQHIEDFPFEHSLSESSLKPILEKIKEYAPYNSNAEYATTIKGIGRLSSYNLQEQENAFKYLLNLQLIEKFKLKELDGEGDVYLNPSKYDIYNLKHIIAHSLGDINFGNKKYDLAIEYYKKSVFDYPLNDDEDGIENHLNDILFAIAKSYYKWGKTDECFAYIAAMLFSGESINTVDERVVNVYLEKSKISKNQFKRI